MEDEVLITASLLAEDVNSADASDGGSAVTAVLLLSTFVVATGSFVYGCALGYSSPAESGIKEELGISTAGYSVFGSMLTIGGMGGALVVGKVADAIGRKGTFWFLETFCIIGWLAIAFAKGAWCLDLGRIALGFGLGAQAFVTPIYSAEITPKNIRGGLTALNQFSLSCGLSLMFFIGNVINWRTLALVGTIPCVVQFLGTFFIPESPRWLAKIGQEKEVEPTLQWLRGKNVDVSQEAAEIRVGVGLISMVQLGGANGIIFYASSILDAAGSFTRFGTTAVAIIQIPFSTLSVLFMDKLGRRPLLMVTAAGACLGSFLAALAFLLQDLHQQEELTAVLVLSGILIYSASVGMGLCVTPLVIMSEVFPMNIKSAAGSLAILALWFSSWIVTYAFNFLFEWSSTGVFFTFTSICASIVIFVVKLVPETKGKTLEEIQASMIQLLQ